jgi:hypothetical protein
MAEVFLSGEETPPFEIRRNRVSCRHVPDDLLKEEGHQPLKIFFLGFALER